MKPNINNRFFMAGINKICRTVVILTVVYFCNSTLYAQTWAALGGGMNGYVYATTVYNGALIVAGQFTMAGGVPANNIARWNGLAWENLGSGLDDKVSALTVYNGELIAGGQFTKSGALVVNFLAAWNGTSWSAHLGSMNSYVAALTVDGTDLVAGGYFTNAGGTPANYIASYNAVDGWVALGSGMGGTEAQVLCLTTAGGNLTAGGAFTTAGGGEVNHIARWNGISWSSYGSGISGVVYSLAGYNGSIAAGGLFTTAGGIPANNIALWNGMTWLPFGGGTAGTNPEVLSLSVYNGKLYAGGLFTTAGYKTVNGIARWNGTSWHPLAGGVWNPGPFPRGVYTMSGFNADLVAGGIFDRAGTVNLVGNVAAWNEPVVPATLNIQGDTVSLGQDVCYDALQTITVAGGATSFIVKNFGYATMIAGEKIIYLPGTKVEPGGNMYGRITQTAEFCGAFTDASSAIKEVNNVQPSLKESSGFKVYPNPSTGTFFIDPLNEIEPATLRVEVLNMMGNRVLSFVRRDRETFQFSLSDHSPGIYFVRLISEARTVTLKVVKED